MLTARYGEVTTPTLSFMVNPRLRAIRRAKAKLLRGEREAQQISAWLIVLALVAILFALAFAPVVWSNG